MDLRSTAQDLAAASRADVLRAWSGLWFNRRAINLHEACKQIVVDIMRPSVIAKEWNDCGNPSGLLRYRSQWHNVGNVNQIDFLMSDYLYLKSLPWIGDYTANAILAFAYNMEVSVLDINIKRVLIHSFDLPHDISNYDLQILALSLVPVWSSRDRHNALMDYGSAVLDSKATWIQSAKQSKFAWSDREVRGWIFKQLAANSKLTLATTKKIRANKDVDTIVSNLQKENIISVVGWKISISEW
jgi:A/G-specific adenine glycosylase